VPRPRPRSTIRPARLGAVTSLGLGLGLCLLTLACPAPPPAAERQADTEARTAAQANPSPTPSAATNRPEFVLAPATGEVAEIVAAAQAQAASDGRTLLVYVGASWCEPCQYFHAAVDEGTLDDSLAGVRLLEFDADQDRERLRAAGYSSRMIPLFVAPGPDGRAGPRRSEGGVKGPAAVEDLRKRLVALVRAARADG
jgi:thiol-disulfide isomerase/thioredoxin